MIQLQKSPMADVLQVKLEFLVDEVVGGYQIINTGIELVDRSLDDSI